MPYFPERREIPPYHCQGCGGWFRQGTKVCCVAHAPGTCCHEYETRVEPPVQQQTRPKSTRRSEFFV